MNRSAYFRLHPRVPVLKGRFYGLVSRYTKPSETTTTAHRQSLKQHVLLGFYLRRRAASSILAENSRYYEVTGINLRNLILLHMPREITTHEKQ